MFFFNPCVHECNEHTYAYNLRMLPYQCPNPLCLWDLWAGSLFMTIVSDRLNIGCNLDYELWLN